jgi:D-alanine-D-alanine ligase
MPEKTIVKIQQLSKQAHVALGCKGYSRTDMFVSDNDGIYIIETNTLPGMTPTSILPQQAAAAGISFSDLLDQIIDNA